MPRPSRPDRGNADNYRKHRRHPFFLNAETPIHRAEPNLHRRKAAPHRGEALLRVAHFACQRQNARSEELQTDFFLTHPLPFPERF
jgi:hypothetical protein